MPETGPLQRVEELKSAETSQRNCLARVAHHLLPKAFAEFRKDFGFS